MKKLCFLCYGICLIGLSCTSEKEVDVELPPFIPSTVVEGYLEPGNPFYLTLIKSVGFFDPVKLLFEKEAEITITFDDNVEKLSLLGGTLPDSIFGVDFQGFEGDSFYVYITPEIVPRNYNTFFNLNISLPDGKELTAETFIPRPIPIDTVEWRFNQDSQAFVIVRFQDPPDEENYYWYVRHDGTLENNHAESTPLDDRISDGQQIALASGFDYVKGDTVILTLYHIPEDYYQFLERNEASQRANLSPFGLPASAFSNVNEGLGIFTGYSRDRKRIIIE